MFDIRALNADDQAASLSLATSAIRPQPGYPHAIDLEVVFTLDDAGLTLDVAMRNVGDNAGAVFLRLASVFPAGGRPRGQLAAADSAQTR